MSQASRKIGTKRSTCYLATGSYLLQAFVTHSHRAFVTFIDMGIYPVTVAYTAGSTPFFEELPARMITGKTVHCRWSGYEYCGYWCSMSVVYLTRGVKCQDAVNDIKPHC